MTLTRAHFLTASGASVLAAAMTPKVWADMSRPRALVLSGGIAEGVYEAGVVKALLEHGYEFDVICGTSIGALNGALIAQHEPDRLFDIWHTLGRADPPITKLTAEAQQILDEAVLVKDPSRGTINRILALRALIKKAGANGSGLLHINGIFDPLGAQNVLRVLDLTKVQTTFLWATSNVDRGRAEAFGIVGKGTTQFPPDANSSVRLNTLDASNAVHRAMYPEAVRASGAFPLAFAPVPLPSFEVAGETDRYLDGGVANNTPIRLARKAGARSAICVFLQQKGSAPQRPVDDIGIALNLYTANQQQLLDDELILASEYTAAVRMAESVRGPLALQRAGDNPLPPPIDLFEIRPSHQLALDAAHQPFGFDRQDLLDADFKLGYDDGSAGPMPFAPPRYPFSLRISPVTP